MSEQVTALERQVTALERQVQAFQADVKTLVIVDAVTYERAGLLLRAVAGYIKRVGEVMDQRVADRYDEHRREVGRRDALLKPAHGVKRLIGEYMGAWDQEQARRRREQEETARRERERQEREARERAAAEERRLKQEAEDRRLADAAALEAKGDKVGAERLISEPVVVAPVAPVLVFAPRPPVASPPPKVEGVSYREGWQFEIERPDLLPREYLVPDEKKIRGVVNALGDKANIPGVRVTPRRIASVKA